MITLVFLLVIAAAHPALASPTTTAVTLSTPTVVMGGTTTATATVTDTGSTPAAPTGTVTWSDGGTSGTYDLTCTLVPLSTSQSSCSITYGPGGAFSSVTLTATYSGDGSHSTSVGSAVITVDKRATATSISPNPVQITKGDVITFTATVADTSPPPVCCFTPDVNPVSAVVWIATPPLGTFGSSGVCSLSRVPGSDTDSSCSITYTATASGSVTITGSYTGDNVHEPSAGMVVSGGNPPVADAGPDQTASPGMIVVLDGTASFDPDGDPLTYSWTQTAGPPVTLTGANTPTPSFTAPPAAVQSTLTFQLTVSDGVFSRSDTVDVVTAPSTIFSFDPPIDLNAAGAVGTHPTVAVSGNNVYVVWTNHTGATTSFTKSTDAGATFGPVLSLSPPPSICTSTLPCVAGGGNAAPVVASSGNHVYVAWVDVSHGVFLASSDDGGFTFSRRVNVVPMGYGQGSLVQIGASGDFVHLLSSCTNCGPNVGYGQVFFSTSADFGRTFTTTTLSDTSGGCCTQIAVSQNNVYVTWEEDTSPPTGVLVVKFASSTNNGATLNVPLTLSNPANISQFPQMAISGSAVYVVWHDETAGEVMFTSSTNGGATFGSASNLLTGVIGLTAIPGLAADGSGVYALNAPQSGSAPIEFKASSNSAGTFGPSQVLNNSPLFPGAPCCVYPQIAAQGSGVYVVWTALPASSTSRDVAFVYSTNNGASFGGPINLSNNPDYSELSFGAASTFIGKVDEMAVSGGRVHIVWTDGNASNTAWTIKYVTGTLVPSAFSVASTGGAFTSVTKNPSGATEISQTDSTGTLLASVTLPSGSSVPSGTVNLTYSSVAGVNEVQVSGVSVPYPPGKSVSFLVDPATTAVCIDDEPSATLAAGACTTGVNNIPYNLPCQANVATSSGPLTFLSGPSPRTYTCTIVPGTGTSSYAVVDGLAYSAVASVLSPEGALHHLIAVVDGMHLAKGITQSLDAKLRAALSSIQAGQNIAAVNQLNAFIREVRAETQKQLSSSQAQALITDAQAIVIELSP